MASPRTSKVRVHRRGNETVVSRPTLHEMLNERKYTVKEASRLLSKGESTIWTMLGDGRLEFFKLGKSVRIPERAVIRLLEEGYVPARQSA